MNSFRVISVIIFLLISCILTAQSDKNFIIEKNYIKALNSTSTNQSDFNAKISYFDGLGRKIQQIETDENNNSVINYEYDENNVLLKEYLPYDTPSGNIDYITDFNQILQNRYNSNNPYSKSRYEKVNYKLLEKAFPGEDWNMDNTVSHTIKNEYKFNVDNEVKRYAVNSSVVSLVVINEISSSGFYPSNVLKKQIQKNENWTPQDQKNNTTELFFNEYNNIVLSRVYNNNVPHDTYYVYNEANQIVAVIPPMSNGDVSSGNLEKWCYLYNYDINGRLVEKKLPQKEWEYIIYDKADRVVLTGPVYNPFGDATKGWLLTKYDALGRVVYTGYYAASTFTSTARNTLAQNNFTAESKTASNITIDGIAVRYTNTSFPTAFKLLTVNYYDNYSYPNAPTAFTTIETQTVNTAVKGQLTGTWTRTLTTASSTAGTLSYDLYDSKYRVIRSYSQNHLGGYTQTDSKLNFSGLPTKTITNQKLNTGSAVLDITANFSYDKNNRLLTHTQQINGTATETIVSNVYDELGRLKTKNVGGATGNLQKVDYTYNIRGWLTDINNEPDSPDDLYNQKIYYNNPKKTSLATGAAISTPLYNGNINYVETNTLNDNILRGYRYEYDDISRLKEADFFEGLFILNSTPKGHFKEHLTYDKNGNIITLNRTGELINDQAIEIDDLTYTYSGNQLQTVTDATNNPDGFNDGNTTGADFVYDTVGNITQDKNKGITNVKYNHLNLPVEIIFTSGKINYIYDAAGTRLSKKVQPTGGTLVTTDYVNGFQYENNVLQFFPHAEGYVKRNTNNTYLYVYQYKDHLGNVRLSYADVNKNGTIEPATEILEENNYYPFGLKHKGYNEIANSNRSEEAEKYKFQEQERNEELGLNWDSFKWRNYDYAIGRFMNIDPLTEKYNTWSPYAFSGNRVIDARELEGLEPMSIHSNTRNLVIAVQGYGGRNPKYGATQSQNAAEYGRNMGVDRDGLGRVLEFNDLLRGTQAGVFTSGHHEATKKDVLSTIKDFKSNYEYGKVILIGHSLGADNLVEMLKENKDIQADLLITVDISDDWSDTDIPSNVKNVYNFYNKNAGFFTLGGNRITIDNPEVTKGVNIPLDTTHTDIDNDFIDLYMDIIDEHIGF